MGGNPVEFIVTVEGGKCSAFMWVLLYVPALHFFEVGGGSNQDRKCRDIT
jgi:hypothetical protein